MKPTCCTSSNTVTEMSEFPMPKEIGMFPHNIDVREYLESYAENFNLKPHIQLNTSVSEVKKEGEKWHVTCSTGDTYTSTYLVVATGALQTRYQIESWKKQHSRGTQGTSIMLLRSKPPSGGA